MPSRLRPECGPPRAAPPDPEKRNRRPGRGSGSRKVTNEAPTICPNPDRVSSAGWVLVPIVNSDLHVVGQEFLRIGPQLRAKIADIAGRAA